MEEKNNQLDIELNEDVAEGIYSNLAIISHSNSEFVIDFIKTLPGVPKAKVKSRYRNIYHLREKSLRIF